MIPSTQHLHQCRHELHDHISPGAVVLLLCIAGIALFSLTSGHEEPYNLVEETPELEELQRAYDLPMKELWERLLPNLDQLDFVMEIVYNFHTDRARAVE